MNYTLFAIACYIFMRGLQVLFEEYAQKSWYKIVIKSVTAVMLYAALASLVNWYMTADCLKKFFLLGFDPAK
jgi:hypothetical protein